MQQRKKIGRIALVGPVAPPFGGMANQMNLLHRLLRNTGIYVNLVPTNRSTPSIENLSRGIPGVRTAVREIFFLARMIRNFMQCEVVHVIACSHTYFFLNVVPAVLIAKLFKKRVLVNYRGGEALRFFNTTGKPFLWVLRKADVVTVPSGYLRDIFRGFGVEAGVVPNIIELDHFAFRPPHRSGPRRYLCTRNFEPYYDVETLVRAFRIVRERFPNAGLTLVGDGSRRPHIEKQLKDLQLQNAVTLAGRVDPARIPYYLDTSDIFVNSSVTDNYPNSILEAFACGLPVVTTSAGGIPYLVENGVNGLVVPPGDERGLAEAMIRVATEPNLFAELVRAGKDTADRHSWAGIWPILRKEYALNRPLD